MDNRSPSIPARYDGFLDDRQKKHIAFCQVYAEQFAHGAPGHMDFMLINLLVGLLSDAGHVIADLQREVDGIHSVEHEEQS